MSWHYLQGQEAASWEGSCLDGAPSALLSLIHMQENPCLQDRPMDALKDSPYGMTSQPLMENPGKEKSMSLAVDSPVRTYHQQEKVKESQAVEVGYGSTWRELYMRYDPATFLLKTHHCLWEEVLPLFSVILPKWGMMQDGVFWERTTVMEITYERDVGYWPTPLKNEGPGGSHLKLTDAVAVAEGFRPRYHQLDGMEGRKVFTGKVNPEWAEWLMGWPMGWTNALQELATDRFRQWLDSHGKRSPMGEPNKGI